MQQLHDYRLAVQGLLRPPLFQAPQRPSAIRTVLVAATTGAAEFDIDRPPRSH